MYRLALQIQSGAHMKPSGCPAACHTSRKVLQHLVRCPHTERAIQGTSGPQDAVPGSAGQDTGSC